MSTISADAIYLSSHKKATSAWLWWLFAGGVGAHMYYVGRPILGTVILVLSSGFWIFSTGMVAMSAAGAPEAASMGVLALLASGLWGLLVLATALLINGSVRRWNARLLGVA
ncbi:MAG: NINE protein [Amaricoccus sp.]